MKIWMNSNEMAECDIHPFLYYIGIYNHLHSSDYTTGISYDADKK